MLNFLWILIRSFFSRDGLLILLQNNNELRAGGGFITKVIRVSSFKIKFLDVFTDLSSDFKFTCPDYLKKMLGENYQNLQFRDANYEFNWDNNGKRLKEIYQKITGERLRFIIGINFNFVEKIYNIIEKKNDLFYKISSEVSDIDRHSKNERHERKNIIKIIGKNLIKRSIIKFWLWPNIFKTVNQSIQQKDIQIFDEKNIKEYTFPEDFLAVIDHNLIGGKSNRTVRRTVKHDSELKGNKMVHNLSITWDNLGNFDPPFSVPYRAWCQVHIPKNAQLKTTGNFHVENFKSGQAISFPLLVKLKQSFSTQIKYETPFTNTEKYTFSYIQQPGITNNIFLNSFNFSQKYLLVHSNRGRIKNENLFFESIDTNHDILFECKLKKNPHPLRIFSHEIVYKNIVKVFFNEPIEETKNFKLKLSDNEKDFPILNHKILENILEIEISIPEDTEHFYFLTMQGLRGLASGNTFKNDQRTVTVVWRG